MRLPAVRALLVVAALTLLPLPAAAQAPVPDLSGRESALRVFLDCATWRCREDRFRQEITWVNWVREPQDAQVYVILTGQETGGGFQYAFDFEGRGALAELADRYLYTSSSTDVEEEVVAGLTRTLALGLVRFVGQAGFVDMVEITGVAREPATEAELEAEQANDPWNYWVFSINGNAELEKEDLERQEEYRVNLSANRTTEMWKIDIGGGFDYSRREVTVDEEDEEDYVDERDDWDADALVVRSLSPHWSVGFRADAGSSTRFNRDFGYGISPAIEWNYFPWQESTRRRLVALYTVGVEYRDYEEETVYNRLKETLFLHRLDLQYRVQEPWGNIRLGGEVRQYLRYTEQYSVELDANIEYRLIRGLGLNVGASYEVIRDQRYLSGAGLDPEEILLSRRELATGSRVSFDIGLSYRFGSIFNNVVNARFPGMGGFGGGFN